VLFHRSLLKLVSSERGGAPYCINRPMTERFVEIAGVLYRAAPRRFCRDSG